MTAQVLSRSKRGIQAAILAAGLFLAHVALTQVTGYDVTASGFSGFQFNAGALNPPLQLHRGRSYNFNIGTGPSHPFWIKTAQVVGSGSAYNSGIGGVGNGQTAGTMTFTVPQDAPDTLFYICGIHSNMTGTITVLPAPRAHDFDGDGRSDIFWRNSSTGENYLYPMDGTAILPAEGYVRTVAQQAWQVAGIGDFDGDGKADLLWRNASTGENYVYFMDGKTIKPTEGYLRTVPDPDWKVAGVGDLDRDGKADILWRNSATGENYVYPMDGLAILGTEGYLRTVADQAWKVVGTGDFNGDGRTDILWRNSSTGENYVYPMNGLAILGTEGYLRTVADQAWKVAGTADFNGDGKTDILWRNSGTGENYLYPMDGLAILGTEGYLRTVADQNWKVQATGDYDGSGKADIFWRNGATGETYFYLMDGVAIAAEGYGRNVPLAWSVAGPGGPGAPQSCAELGSPQLLANGNFDAGPTSHWVQASEFPLIVGIGDLPILPHTSPYAAWLGGLESKIDSLYQAIAVPVQAGQLTISGRLWIATQESASVFDTFNLSIRSTGNALLETPLVRSNLDSVESWVPFQVSAAGNYAGSTVRLHLTSTNDSSFVTNFFVDTLSVTCN